MNKLTKTQIKCIEEMKSEIDEARKYDSFEEWIINHDIYLAGRDNPREYLENNRDYYDGYRKYYEKYKNGIVLVSGYGKPTLEALSKRDIITVVEYVAGRKNGVIDWVKLNNY
jgi:hypothetical protein